MCVHAPVCTGSQQATGPQPCQRASERGVGVGRDYFHEGLGGSWEEGQAGVRFSIKTSVLGGTVTWICPQLSVPWTHGNTDERRFFSGDLERLWVQEQPPFGNQVISRPPPLFGGFRTPELS